MQFTCVELSERLGVTKVVANGLVRHLLAVNKARIVDGIKNVDKNGTPISGRPTLVYEVDGNSVSLDFSVTAPVSYKEGTRPRHTEAEEEAAVEVAVPTADAMADAVVAVPTADAMADAMATPVEETEAEAAVRRLSEIQNQICSINTIEIKI